MHKDHGEGELLYWKLSNAASKTSSVRVIQHMVVLTSLQLASDTNPVSVRLRYWHTHVPERTVEW